MKKVFLDTNILMDFVENRKHSGTDPVVLVNKKKKKRFFFCILLVFLYLCKQRVLTC